MGANFANIFGKPPDVWYMMGVAAGMMTKTNKLGFVAAFPLAWTDVFVNAYTLGAQSVNPDVQVIVAYTFAWGDSAKEAETTNSLINQEADVITMHVDSPQTIVSTAESRGCLFDRLPEPGCPAVCSQVLDHRSGLYPWWKIHLVSLHRPRQDLDSNLPALRTF